MTDHRAVVVILIVARASDVEQKGFEILPPTLSPFPSTHSRMTLLSATDSGCNLVNTCIATERCLALSALWQSSFFPAVPDQTRKVF